MVYREPERTGRTVKRTGRTVKFREGRMLEPGRMVRAVEFGKAGRVDGVEETAVEASERGEVSADDRPLCGRIGEKVDRMGGRTIGPRTAEFGGPGGTDDRSEGGGVGWIGGGRMIRRRPSWGRRWTGGGRTFGPRRKVKGREDLKEAVHAASAEAVHAASA